MFPTVTTPRNSSPDVLMNNEDANIADSNSVKKRKKTVRFSPGSPSPSIQSNRSHIRNHTRNNTANNNNDDNMNHTSRKYLKYKQEDKDEEKSLKPTNTKEIIHPEITDLRHSNSQPMPETPKATESNAPNTPKIIAQDQHRNKRHQSRKVKILARNDSRDEKSIDIPADEIDNRNSNLIPQSTKNPKQQQQQQQQQPKELNFGPLVKTIFQKDWTMRTTEDRRLISNSLATIEEYSKFPEYIRNALSRVVTYKIIPAGIVYFDIENDVTISSWSVLLKGRLIVSMTLPPSSLSATMSEQNGISSIDSNSTSTSTGGSTKLKEYLIQPPYSLIINSEANMPYKHIRTVEECEMILIEKQDLVRTIKYANEKHLLEKVELLHSSPCFSKIMKKTLTDMASNMTMKKYKANSMIFYEGDVADYFYVIKSGKCAVLMILSAIYPPELSFNRNTKPETVEKLVTIKTLQAGNFFGEYAIIHDIPRTTSILATEETELLLLKKQDFMKISQYGDTLETFKENIKLYPSKDILLDEMIKMEQTQRWEKYKRNLVETLITKK